MDRSYFRKHFSLYWKRQKKVVFVQTEVREDRRIRRIWEILGYVYLVMLLKFVGSLKSRDRHFIIGKKPLMWDVSPALKEEMYRLQPSKNLLTRRVVDTILELRNINKLGPERIKWYLERYHGIKCNTSYPLGHY